MMRILSIIGIIALSISGFATPVQADQVSPSATVFVCQHFKDVRQIRKGRTKDDMHIQVAGNPNALDGAWQIKLPNQAAISATPFEANFGMHGSLGLSWTDVAGKTKRAYVAFGESHDAFVFFWFNFDKPSTFFPPGYGCDNNAQIPSEKAA